MTPDEALSSSLSRLLPSPVPRCIGVAVSGGSDSTALLFLLADWCERSGVTLHTATVDHGLRPEAAAEAESVAALAASLSVSHDTLTWRGWDGRGNLQAAARGARQAELRAWAGGRDCHHICLGHTMDDQAETFLLRLSRGSGVDGLSGMSGSRRDANGLTWVRPLLGVRREALRDLLRARGLAWIDDPSNDDFRYDRVRIRRGLASGNLGLDVETLAETAGRMAQARVVLSHVARDAALRVVEVDRGDVLLNQEDWRDLPDETRLRILAETLCRVGGNPYRPRLKSLLRATAELQSGRRASLHGCLVTPSGDRLRISREPAALRDVITVAPGLWDNRWQIDGPADAQARIGILGEAGLAERPDWRDAALPRQSLLASPALWKNDKLLAAPLIDAAGPWRAHLVWDKADLCEGLLSH